MAAAGPAMSLSLAVGLRGLGRRSARRGNRGHRGCRRMVAGRHQRSSGAVPTCLPGAPLDGGRICAPTCGTGTAGAGRSVAYALIGLGLLEFLLGSLVGGVWMAFIGWFLLTAARQEEAPGCSPGNHWQDSQLPTS